VTRSPFGFVAAVALVAGLMAAAVRVQAERERRYPPAVEMEQTLYTTSGPLVRRLSLGHTALAADVYWIRALQHYGGIKRRLAAESLALSPPRALVADPSVDYPLLFPLLDLTTTLDPRFNVAYRFGAIFLAEPFPSGPGRTDLAILLLEKGLRERPDKWEYMQDIGFVHYWYRQDYRAAAQWFGAASQVQGAPWWLRSLAATTLAQGGDRRSSRQMWTAIAESAEVDWLRQDAERRLLQLRALDEVDALASQVSAFLGRAPRSDVTWAALVGARAVPGVMLDPSGTPYEVTAEGTVQLSKSSPLWPLPEEPSTSGTRPPS
jgi:hypothetical protein